MRKVMVFGVFDGLHDGHRELFREARTHGDYLIAVVARDHIVELMKGRPSRETMHDRLEKLEQELHIDRVVLGDEEHGAWEIVRKLKPDLIALGYDQKELFADLERHQQTFDWGVEIQMMSPHKPETLHSSILNKKD